MKPLEVKIEEVSDGYIVTRPYSKNDVRKSKFATFKEAVELIAEFFGVRYDE